MRGLILGFDGVLVDERPVQTAVLRQVFSEEGLEEAGKQAAEAFVRGEVDDFQLLIQETLERNDAATPGLAPRLAVRRAAFYQMRLRHDGHRAIDGARDFIDRAVAAGWMLSLVSPTAEAEVEAALEQLGVRRHFKAVRAAADLNVETYRQAWRELNALPPLPSRLLHPHEVFVVDASPVALKAASEAGLVTVGLTLRYPEEALGDVERIIGTLGDLFADS